MLRRSGRDDLVGQSTTTMSIIILIFVLCHMPRLGKLTTDSSTRFHLIRVSTFPGKILFPKIHPVLSTLSRIFVKNISSFKNTLKWGKTKNKIKALYFDA